MKNYIVLDGMIGNQKDVLHTAFDEGYKQGVENTAKQFQPELNRAYNDGLNDAWDAARKICTNWVLSDKALSDIFGEEKTIDDIMQYYLASEAIAKIKEYEEKCEEDTDIKVGDEVIDDKTNGVGVVTRHRSNYRKAYKRKGVSMTKEDFNILRTELLERGDEMVSIRDLVERFEEVDAYFDETPWNLGQIFSNFSVFAGEKCVPISVIDDIKVEISEKITEHLDNVRGKKDRKSEYLFALCDALEIIEKHMIRTKMEVER